MILQRCILPVLKPSASLRYFAGFRKVSTNSDANIVSALFATSRPNSDLSCICLPTQPLRRTSLYDFHIKHGAKMVPFAGYHMPLVYGDVGQGCVPFNFQKLNSLMLSIVANHQHVRQCAGLFDVGHMVQSK